MCQKHNISKTYNRGNVAQKTCQNSDDNFHTEMRTIVGQNIRLRAQTKELIICL